MKCPYCQTFTPLALCERGWPAMAGNKPYNWYYYICPACNKIMGWRKEKKKYSKRKAKFYHRMQRAYRPFITRLYTSSVTGIVYCFQNWIEYPVTEQEYQVLMKQLTSPSDIEPLFLYEIAWGVLS